MRGTALVLLLAAGPVAAEDGFALDMTFAEAWHRTQDGSIVRDLAVGERGYVSGFYLCDQDGVLSVPLDVPLMRGEEIEAGISGLLLRREAGGVARLSTTNMDPSEMLRVLVTSSCAATLDSWGFDDGLLRVLSVNDMTSASALAATVEAPE